MAEGPSAKVKPRALQGVLKQTQQQDNDTDVEDYSTLEHEHDASESDLLMVGSGKSERPRRVGSHVTRVAEDE